MQDIKTNNTGPKKQIPSHKIALYINLKFICFTLDFELSI